MKRTTIYFNESKLNRLKEFSYRNKISVSDTIRLAIDNLLDEKGIEDKINYKDIIGIAEGPDNNNISEKVEEFLKERFKQ